MFSEILTDLVGSMIKEFNLTSPNTDSSLKLSWCLTLSITTVYGFGRLNMKEATFQCTKR